ncbi:MAG: RDD family protein [Bdellovibrionales bacterium]|nr:RDD family protein [Bdellovibrionales bacterium]
MRYAGFWRRFAAISIDLFILSLVTALFQGVYLLVNDVAVEDLDGGRLQIFNILAFFVFAFIYFSISHFQWGCTLGKRLLGVRVVDAKTLGPLGAWQSMGRYLAYYLSYFILLIGFLLAALTSKKRSLHDYICSTVCVVR